VVAPLDTLPPELRDSRPVAVLRRSLARNRLAHAILLHGSDLRALEETALALSGELLRTDAPLEHPDLFTLRPARKARLIRITGDQGKVEPNTMRWVLRALAQTSNQGGHKVGLVVEADRMNASAANAFLKTLEEPPPDTVLILVTTRPYGLLDTIRSRCLNFRLPSADETTPDEDWQTWLSDYGKWMESAFSRPRGKDAGRTLLNVHGLVSRYNFLAEALADGRWEEEQERLPPHITVEEKDAHETGLRRDVRRRLFADIAAATLHFGRTRSPEEALRASRALGPVTQTLERTASLLEVYLSPDTALEFFLIRSLRLWAAS